MPASRRSARPPAAIQVTVAVPSAAVGRRIADALLDARLCACAQIVGPVTSRYTWKGKRATAREWLLFLKTRRALFDAVGLEVVRLHPYDLPEIVATPLRPAHVPYLRWVTSSTRAPRKSPPTGRRNRL